MIRIAFFLLLWISSAHAEGWPGKEFTTVKAYQYEPAARSSPSIVEKGVLSKTAKGGKELSQAQVKALLAAVRGKHPDHERKRCFIPHHGFVFFDKEGQIVAYLSICFTCGTYRAEPEGTAEYWDLAGLQKIFEQLKLL